MSEVKLTFEEFVTYDDGTDNRYEYEDGMLKKPDLKTGLHEEIKMKVLFLFSEEIALNCKRFRAFSSGIQVKTSWHTGEQSRQPDCLILRNEQYEEYKNKSAILISPPLLVVEVVSGQSSNLDYGRKREEYQTMGIEEYWIADPLKNILTILNLVDGVYQKQEFTGSEKVKSKILPTLNLSADVILLNQ